MSGSGCPRRTQERTAEHGHGRPSYVPEADRGSRRWRPRCRSTSARRSPSRPTTAPARSSDVEHVVFLMQENRSFDHYFGTHARRARLRRPARGEAAVGQVRVAPAERRRRAAAVPPERRQISADVPARPAARLDRHARRLERRQVRPVGAEQGRDDDGVSHAEGHAVPLRARRRVHGLRQLPLLAAGPDRPEPLPHVDRLGRQRRRGRRPGHHQRRSRLRLVDLPGAARARPASPGRSTRTSASASTPPASGAGPTTRTSATTATTRCSTSTSTRTRRPARRSPTRPRPGTDINAQDRDPDELLRRSSATTCAAAGCRRCRGSSRPRRTPSTRTGRRTSAPGTSRRSSTSSPSNPEVWSKTALFVTYDEDGGFFDHLVPPTPPQTARARAVDRRRPPTRSSPATPDHAGRPVRPRHARADDRRLAVEPGRLGQLAAVRPHVADPLPRGALRRRQAGPDRDQHHAVAARGRRRPHHARSTSGRRTRSGGCGCPTPTTSSPSDLVRHPDQVPVPPADRRLPRQERGVRPARALPYTLHADGEVVRRRRSGVDSAARGAAAGVFQVRSADGPTHRAATRSSREAPSPTPGTAAAATT